MTRSPVWLSATALATIAAFVLMMAFQHVVHEGVLGAAVRHKAMADLRDALWRCNTLRVRKDRDSCVSKLTLVRRDALRTQGVAAWA